MPQLRAKEGHALLALLVEHVDEQQLSRALKYSGLSSLSELAGDGNLRDKTDAVLTALSRQYKIIELIEALLPELNNSCPPLVHWLAEHRTELEHRRDHPTIGDRLVPQWRSARRSFAFGGAAVFAAAWMAWALWPEDQGPHTSSDEDATVHIYDSATEEQIGEPFDLTVENRSARNTVYREVNGKIPGLSESSLDEAARVTIECPGFVTKAESAVKDVTGAYSFYLDRDKDRYLALIQPDVDLVPLPSDSTIKVALQNASIPAQDVVFLVRNESDNAIDVLLYYWPPSDRALGPFERLKSRWTLIGPVLPGKWSAFDNFQLPDGYFAYFVSKRGEDARLLGAEALYQARFAILEYRGGDSAKIQFQDNDPRP